MTLQFIHDNKGNTTGVFIPIEEWQSLKTKYSELQIEEVENVTELSHWQRQILDQRLNEYYSHPEDLLDFNKTLDDLDKSL
ncbi:MAG: hypothetical protein KA981_12090 [Bacteroidia bacterium]|nr:hypothetical protein [Bacteroidia bacterium]